MLVAAPSCGDSSSCRIVLGINRKTEEYVLSIYCITGAYAVSGAMLSLTCDITCRSVLWEAGLTAAHNNSCTSIDPQSTRWNASYQSQEVLSAQAPFHSQCRFVIVQNQTFIPKRAVYEHGTFWPCARSHYDLPHESSMPYWQVAAARHISSKPRREKKSTRAGTKAQQEAPLGPQSVFIQEREQTPPTATEAQAQPPSLLLQSQPASPQIPVAVQSVLSPAQIYAQVDCY